MRRFASAEGQREAALSGEFSDWAILRENLESTTVPRTGASWGAVWEFALSYDGYALWQDVGSHANRVAARWVERGDLPRNLDSLRACLFFEQRRYRHFGTDPS